MDTQGASITGGYDYQFVQTPPDMLICKICHLPSREPYLTGCCGHTFCKSCLECVKESTVLPSSCPVCRSEQFTFFPNKQNERVIKGLYVFCTSKERGCEWQGEINDINSHLDDCQFEEVACPNNCGTDLQRKSVNDHLENECPRRKVDCQYCNTTDELQYIKRGHMEKCLKFPLPCPNCCGMSNIPREDVRDHRKVCPLEEVGCPNECGTTVDRQDLDKHIDKECPCRTVGCPYCQVMGEQQLIEGQHVQICPKFPLVCPNKCEAIGILREDMEMHKKECPLEMIQCGYHSVGCMTMLTRKDLQKHYQEKMEEHLSLTMSELVNTRDKLTITEHQLTSSNQQLELSIEQTSSMKTKFQEKIDAIEYQSQQSVSRLEIKLATITEKALHVQEKLQAKIDSLECQSQMNIVKLEKKLQQTNEHIEWTANINCRASHFKNQAFPVIIKVPEFDDKKKSETNWSSHYFFTHEKGYKIKLNVFPAGRDSHKGTHVSVYLYLMKGPNDNDLTWPLKKRIQVKLLNQVRDTQHHSHAFTISAARRNTVEDDKKQFWYAEKFVSQASLHQATADCKFLFNDCVFFEVSEVKI